MAKKVMTPPQRQPQPTTNNVLLRWNTWLRQIVPRLLLAAVLLALLRPGPVAVDVQRLLASGDDATTLEGTVKSYSRASQRAPGIDLQARYMVVYHQYATTGADKRQLLQRIAAITGWTPELRQEYAELREAEDRRETVPLQERPSLSPAEQNALWWDMVLQAGAQRDWNAGIAHLQRLLEANPGDTQAAYQLGVLLMFDDPDAARSHLRVARANPAYTTLAEQLLDHLDTGEPNPREIGRLLLVAREWRLAEFAFSTSLAADPNDWVSYAYRGYARDQVDGSGLPDFEAAIGLAPTASLPYYFLGLHWREIEIDLDAASDAFTIGYFLEPDNPLLAAEVARTAELTGDQEQAAEWYDIAVAQAPDEPYWHHLRAAFYADNNYRLDLDGMAVIQSSYDRFPDDPHILTSMGYAHYLQGNPQQARNFLRQALTLEGNSARTLYYYGLVMQSLGDVVAALDGYQQALQAGGPDSPFSVLAARAIEGLRSTP